MSKLALAFLLIFPLVAEPAMAQESERHSSIEALEEHYPDGTYLFFFDTPHGNVRDFPVTFTKRGQESRNPDPIQIFLHQHGEIADPNAIDPNEDLYVTWSEFEHGAADPKGIIDDLIFVIMGNCIGVKTVHSGPANPFRWRSSSRRWTPTG